MATRIPLVVGSDGQIQQLQSGDSLAGVSVGSGSFTIASTAPGSPNAGDEWLDSSSGITYRYVNDGSTSQWVEEGLAASIPVYIRHFDINGGYLYCGQAPAGSADSASVWTITRLADSSGVITATAHAYNVAWANRLTETYA